jgi:peroxiredoxin
MRYTLTILLAIITLASCTTPKENEFIVNATVEGLADSTQVFLNKSGEDKRPKTVDTAVVTNGKFTFKGISKKPEMYVINIDKIRGFIPFIAEEGKITITSYKDSLNAAKISGTLNNDILQEFNDKTNEYRKKSMSFRNDMRKAQIAKDTATLLALRDEAFEIQEEAKEFEYNFALENADSYIAVLLLQNFFYQQGQPTEKIQKLYDKLPENLKQSKEVKEIVPLLENVLKVSVGKKAPNFSGPTPTGETLALNDVKGKVTIIDFWAAWCKPCRAENPNVVKIYEKYQDKGLSIVGVSLDRTAEAWKKAIEEDKLPWHQVSNLKYWQEPIAQQYNVRSIPATFILDESGTIVAKDLRGEALEKKIAELLQ